jgi:hypothetical protein
MAVNYDVGALWRRLPADYNNQLKRLFDTATAARKHRRPVDVFFRADDIAAPGKAFNRLMALFAHHRTPLALAVVPAWITGPRWEQMRRLAEPIPSLWGWHQHGWRHSNHALQGKKQEFGPGRSSESLKHDLLRGRRRLEIILGEQFVPIFTPPWNRCGRETLQLLASSNYLAISRSAGASPQAPKRLPEINVNIDLHTRRKVPPHRAWSDLLGDIAAAIRLGRCGFMVHHQRMNRPAFDFLAVLLSQLARHPQFRVTSLTALAQGK